MDYLYFLQNLREEAWSFLNPILLCISEAGLVIAVFAGFIIYWAFDKQSGKKIICGFALSTAFSNFIKDIFCISRPWISDARLHVDPIASKTATGYSFPSGHYNCGKRFWRYCILEKSEKTYRGTFLAACYRHSFCKKLAWMSYAA